MLILLILCSSGVLTSTIKKSLDLDKDENSSKSKDFLIVDVRTPEEHKISRINNSININFYDEKFINMFKKIDYDKHVLIYCRSGRRSLEAVKILTDEGFSKLYDLKGGILALDKLNIDFGSLDD